MKKYYALETSGSTASITIYGDITSWPWMDSDVSSYRLCTQIDGLDVDRIDIFINSYGGEVAEGLAIYNALRRHKAEIVTHCDGFACSAASIVFMAGSRRLMSEASLLMIHNAWSNGTGNAADLRKLADELDTISDVAANAYRSCVNISDDKLRELLDEETWLTPADAVMMGFATDFEDTFPAGNAPAASARESVMLALTSPRYADQYADSIIKKVVALIKSQPEITSSAVSNLDTPSKTFLSALMRKGGYE